VAPCVPYALLGVLGHGAAAASAGPSIVAVALEAGDLGLVKLRPLADADAEVAVCSEADVHALPAFRMGTCWPGDEAGEARQRDGAAGDEFDGDGFEESADGSADIAGREVFATSGGVGDESFDQAAVVLARLACALLGRFVAFARERKLIRCVGCKKCATLATTSTFDGGGPRCCFLLGSLLGALPTGSGQKVGKHDVGVIDHAAMIQRGGEGQAMRRA
jgi:hypothetical protein